MSEGDAEYPAFLAAARRVAGLRESLGDGALRLAYHAAVPVVVDVALLNLLRVNFFLDPPDDLPFEIEAELLLSPLFREIGEGLYEIEPGLRNLLLSGLHDRYGSDRVRRVASLLEQYTDASGAWRSLPELEMAQQLTALSFHDPARAAAWLDANEVGTRSSRVPGGPVRDWHVAMRGRIVEQSTVTTISHELRSALARLDATKDAETRLAVVADIGALTRLSETDVNLVVPALCQFIEAWDALYPGLTKRVSPDVQAALSILGSVGKDVFGVPIRLNDVVLRGANLAGLNFSYADFNRVTLAELSAGGINLSYARFRDVMLEDAVLDGAHLQEAFLEFSALRHVSLSGFSGASVHVAAAAIQDVTAISANGTRLHIHPLGVPEGAATVTDAVTTSPERVTDDQSALRLGTDPVTRAADSDNSATKPIRVLIVDDAALFRRGLEMVLTEEPGIEIVGQACDGAEAVRVAAEAVPDVVLMDIRMPKMTGIEAARAMKRVAPNAKIVILTVSDAEEDLFEAIRAGASGYLLKDIPLLEVAAAVRSVHGGQSLINPSMAGKLLTEFATLARRDAEEEPSKHAPAPKLTEREMEVLRLVARGMNNRDIAKKLLTSEDRVKNHVRNILAKLQIHSRMEAVMIAVRENLIDISGEEGSGRQ